MDLSALQDVQLVVASIQACQNRHATKEFAPLEAVPCPARRNRKRSGQSLKENVAAGR